MSAVDNLSSVDFASKVTAAAAASREGAKPAVVVAAPKSEAQQLLDRILAQCNRFNRIRQDLQNIRRSIAPIPKRPPADVSQMPAPTTAPETSFFEALKMLADGNDKVADELELSVLELGSLF